MGPASTDELPFVATCRTVPSGAPCRWIRLGWRDLLAAPRQSLSYSFVICRAPVCDWVSTSSALAVTMPVIDHAAWHAYREVIDARAWPANL